MSPVFDMLFELGIIVLSRYRNQVGFVRTAENKANSSPGETLGLQRLVCQVRVELRYLGI